MTCRVSSGIFAALTLLLLSSCAEGGSGRDSGPGDTGPLFDAGPDDPDTGPVGCGTGQHACGGGCIDDLANQPANGCRLGCGEPCPTPPDGEAACNAEGACTFACPPPFTEVGGECVCEPDTCDDIGYMCGAPDDGCGGTLDCGACSSGECTDGVCGCPRDAREPNDSFAAADGAALLADIPNEDWLMTYRMFTIHDAGDEDFFRFHVEDSGVVDSDPVIEVTLDGIPTGSNYDLAIYYVCDEGGNDSTCDAGALDRTRGVGCVSSSSGTMSETVRLDVECTPTLSTVDSGTLYVRVTSPTFGGMCQPYELRFDVIN